MRALRVGAGIVLGAALLAGCATSPRPSLPAAGLRDPAVPVYSMAGFDPARITGQWREVAHLAAPGSPGCSGGGLTIRRSAAGLVLDGQLCRAGRLSAVRGEARSLGNGRFALAGEAEPWWVIWADWDNRTLVLATPSGDLATVLDRGQIPPDRLTAAREMLRQNGYQTQYLR